jgi:uncharacterized protein (TIGR02145 family)
MNNVKLSLFLFLVSFAILGCSGDSNMPCVTCSEPPPMYPYNSSSSSWQGSSSSISYVSKGNSISNYRTVQIGSQRWMAENLDYNVSGSKCYGNDDANCAKYGRLYDWATAMALPGCGYGTSCADQISAKHRGICPENWHIPSQAEWDALTTYIESDKSCTDCDAKHLKAQSGWYSCGVSGSSYSCLDTYGFSALPGGFGYSDGYFYDVGNYGIWWSASEDGSRYAYSRDVYYNYEYAIWYNSLKYNLFSVRCLQD